MALREAALTLHAWIHAFRGGSIVEEPVKLEPRTGPAPVTGQGNRTSDPDVGIATWTPLLSDDPIPHVPDIVQVPDPAYTPGCITIPATGIYIVTVETFGIYSELQLNGAKLYAEMDQPGRMFSGLFRFQQGDRLECDGNSHIQRVNLVGP